MQEHLLHSHNVFPVRAELRDDVRYPLLQFEVAFLEQLPDRHGHDSFGRRVDRVERFVCCRALFAALYCFAKRAQACQFPVASHGHLRARQRAIIDIALCAREQRVQRLAVDSYVLRLLRDKLQI